MNSKLIKIIASSALILLAVLVFLSIVMRYIFNSPIPDTLDLSRILLGVVVLWGIALVTVEDDHIQVDLLWNQLGQRIKRHLNLFGRLLFVIFAGLFAWLIFEHVWQIALSGKQTVDYRLPMWIFYLLFVPVGIITLLASIKNLLKAIKRKEPDE